MKKHLGRHLPYFLSMKLSIPYQPCSTAKIQSYPTKTIIHGQAISVTLNATLAAQCPINTFTQSNGGIFNSMMFVHFQITFYFNGQVNTTMLSNLFQHVIKKTNTCGNITFSAAI